MSAHGERTNTPDEAHESGNRALRRKSSQPGTNREGTEKQKSGARPNTGTSRPETIEHSTTPIATEDPSRLPLRGEALS